MLKIFYILLLKSVILQCILFLLLTQPNKMADPEKAMEVENDHEDIEEDDDDVADGTNAKATMAAELLKNPAMFAALQVISPWFLFQNEFRTAKDSLTNYVYSIGGGSLLTLRNKSSVFVKYSYHQGGWAW